MLEFADIKAIRDFKSLIKYLRTHLGWPVDEMNADDLYYEYSAVDLGLDEKAAVKIRQIKQLRPLTGNQPWGIFWIDFEPKRLPVVVMRRVLAALVMTKRGSKESRRAAWNLHDLMFISATGEGQDRGISFAHFQDTSDGLPQLRTFSWDANENHFYYLERVNLECLRWPVNPNDAEAWRENWSSAFTTAHREVITSSQVLASRMARLASATRSLVNDIFAVEQPSGPLHKLYGSFKRVLIHDLSVDDFADMYAQTVTYGLFSAFATNPHSGQFDLQQIDQLIPKTNPFLRELFAECVRVGIGESVEMDLDELGLGELMSLLNQANMEAILQDFGRQTRGEDPVIHFYESFLHEYDAQKKAQRGVFYTPDPVVSFIVRSVDYLLRTEFDCPDGFADAGTMNWKGQQVSKVQVLDPATGTGTFLKYVIEQIYDTFYQKTRNISAAERDKRWNEYVPQHMLPRLYGFELMMAPYAVAHLKLGLTLREKGYKFGSDERLRVYLTNTLQPAHEIPRTDSPLLAHEAEQANVIKTLLPISVVLGNPPYSVNSSNSGEWITDLVKRFYYPNDERKERNPKLLLDDYVKFIRFGQWIINQAGSGVLAFITNHGYLDSPTFRRMRNELLKTFDKMYFLDLHGNSNKKETAPDGSKDENVFDIQQGVAICFMIKNYRSLDKKFVYHSDLFGLRKTKYETLLLNNLNSISWNRITPQEPFYLFSPQNVDLMPEYNSGWLISDIFPVNSMGIKTNHDNLLSDFDQKNLTERISKLAGYEIGDEKIREMFGVEDGDYWNTKRERQKIRDVNWKENITQALYRPFDIRWLLYQQNLIEIGRGGAGTKVMRHMLKRRNIGLVSVRQVAEGVFNHALVSRQIVECRIMVSNKGAGYFYPLYLYPDKVMPNAIQQSSLSFGNTVDKNERVTNFNIKFIRAFIDRLGYEFIHNEPRDQVQTIGPEDIFNYIYAILHSSIYRARYSEFLKLDFPRIPLVSKKDLFKALVKKGNELVLLHLMESPLLNNRNNKFIGWAENSVAAGFPKFDNGNVWINPQQGFEGITNDVWNFYIGGYQVCHKWLKDRRGRQLSEEDIVHYQKIVVAIQETIRLMGEIDAVIEEHGGWPIQ